MHCDQYIINNLLKTVKISQDTLFEEKTLTKFSFGSGMPSKIHMSNTWTIVDATVEQ